MNERIAILRKKLNCKQDDFAETLGLSKNFISLVETGKREPSDRTIKDICFKFNVNETWLRTGKGEMFMPLDREQELAKLTVDLLQEEKESFRNRFISLLARMSDEEWRLLEKMFEELTKKE